MGPGGEPDRRTEIASHVSQAAHNPPPGRHLVRRSGRVRRLVVEGGSAGAAEPATPRGDQAGGYTGGADGAEAGSRCGCAGGAKRSDVAEALGSGVEKASKAVYSSYCFAL